MAQNLDGHRPSYDLIDNRVHALVHHRGRLVIDTGGPDFLKFIDGGWKSSWILGAKEQNQRVAYVAGLSSIFFAPLDTDGDGPLGTALGDVKLRVTMRGLASGQRVSVFANEKAAGTIEVSSEMSAHEIAIPAALLVAGENRFRLQFRAAASLPGGKRSAAAVRRIEIAPAADVATTPEPAFAGQEMMVNGQRKRALSVPGPSRLSYYVQVPEGGKLALSYAGTNPNVRISVRVTRDGGRPESLFAGPALASQWQHGLFDLAKHAGHAVRLDLVTTGGGGIWGEPRIMVMGAQALAYKPKKFDRIFIWMVDTLRADKLRVYNPKTVVESPHYDAFAQDATRFEWAHVPGTWSLPSHASILTGVYPSVHRAIAHEARLSRDVYFAPEVLKKAGYRTGLFSSNGYVSGKWGFDRGWDHSRNFIRESLPNGAEYLWKTAKSWIVANGTKPQFAYLATVEPHVIYNPRKEFLARYWNKPYHGPFKPVLTGIQLGKIKAGKLRVNDTDKEYLQALYHAEITQSDAAFGAFLADLKAAGIYDSTAIIVVSDHGEEFWEHGDVGHAQGVHQELVRIPLIIRAPGMFPAGRVVKADVEAMDVFPTLLELAGLPVPPDVQGSSLVALAHDEPGFSPRAALSQNHGVSRGMKVGRYRFVHAGRLGLYDQVEDPLEQKNVFDTRPIALRQLRNVFGILIAHESRWRKNAWGTAANLTEAFYKNVEF